MRTGRDRNVQFPEFPARGREFVTLGFWPMSAWACETVLEAIAAYCFFRRRITALWLWLGFSALADLTSFLALELAGPRAYEWADYLERNAQFILIAIVSIWAVAAVLREHPKTRNAYMGILGAMAVLCVLSINAHWPPSGEAVLKFEIWAEITLSGFVAAAMGTANGKAPKPWGLIAIALVTLGSSDLLVTALRLKGFRAEEIYPIGEILGLGILALAGWKDWQLEEVRIPVPKKFPPSSVGKAEILEMFGG